MQIDWTSLLVAAIALVGTVYTGRKVQQQSRKPNIVDQAGQVSSLAVNQMNRMAEEIEGLESEVATLRGRVQKLETEIIRLGGDPALVL